MNFVFDTIEDFIKEYRKTESYSHECCCGGNKEFLLEDSNVIIGDYCITVVECPILKCQKCFKYKLGNRMPKQIQYAYTDLSNSEYSSCRLTTKLERFQYVEYANFVYDGRDLNIPGIGFDLDPTNSKGFSCPVFFDKKVLNNFFTDNDYSLNMFSESYGDIAKRGTDGWDWEWNIPFGINKNGNVILFLGDLEQIDKDDRAILWLKSYNIKSDHEILDTEFYRAQFLNEFSEPIIENRIINLRNCFFERVEREFGIALHHLEEEVEASANELRKPINYSKSEIKENIIILDGLLNEGIDCNRLRELYVRVVNPLPDNYKDLKTRKLLQGIIAAVEGADFAKSMISSLFYLNDLRVCYAHLISSSEIDKMMGRIIVAYGLVNEDEFKKLYCRLIKELYELYSLLMIIQFT